MPLSARRRFALLYALPAVVLLLAVVRPLVDGSRTLYLRDVFNTHLEMKWVQAEAMREGRLPLVDPYRGGGQPHLGNPNTVPFYPDNLLYLVADPFWSFNAHFWLHLLLAPFAFYALARAWGLGREGSWIAAVCYAGSGYYLSQLNLYNLVAGATLAPAFAAGLLVATSGRRAAGALAVTALLWTLLLLAGDPVLAVVALLLGLAGVAARWLRPGWPPLAAAGRRQVPWLGAALAAGTLLAAPQIVELLRIAPLSFRGYWGYSAQAAAAASFNPATALDWLLPFPFGRPDLTFWGQAFYSGQPPLFFSFYPGVVALALVLASGRPRNRLAVCAWALIGAGLFFALGRFNPLVSWLLALPGAGLFRFPVKLWLLVAAGASLLAGLAFERWQQRGHRALERTLTALALLYAAAWATAAAAPGRLAARLAVLMPERFAGALVEGERLRWTGLMLLSALLATAAALLLRLLRGRPALGGAGLALLHLAGQLLLLAPLLASDEVAPYRAPPAALAMVPEGARVVHGKSGELFGASVLPVASYPDERLLWLQRQLHQELSPATGARWGRHYDFNLSPEGLDSFLTRTAAQAVAGLADAERLRVLAAAGVDTLLLGRPLDEAARGEVEEVARLAIPGGRDGAPLSTLWIYHLRRAAPEVSVVGRVTRAPHLNAALLRLLAPDFDPRREVVLPGEGGPVVGEGGTARVLARGPETLEVEAEAPAAAVLVVTRANLPLYRAWVDGVPTAIQVANLDRMAVALPAGRHRVRLATDRRPLLASSLAALAGLGLLLWLVRSRRRPAGGPAEEVAPRLL